MWYINWAIAWTFATLWFKSREGQGISLFSKMIRPILGPNKPPTQQTPGVLSFIIKRSGPEVDLPTHLKQRFRKSGAIPPVPHMPS